MRLGAAGNYTSTRVEGTIVYAAFEDDVDAKRFAEVFRPEQTIRRIRMGDEGLGPDGRRYLPKNRGHTERSALTAERRRVDLVDQLINSARSGTYAATTT